MTSYFEKYGQTIITLAAIVAAFVGLVTINGQGFDAQDQRFDAQERFNDRFFEVVNRRLEAQDRLLNQRLDAQAQLMNQRFDAQDRRLDRLADEVSELRRLMVGIAERVPRNEGEIDVIREQLRIADTLSPKDAAPQVFTALMTGRGAHASPLGDASMGFLQPDFMRFCS